MIRYHLLTTTQAANENMKFIGVPYRNRGSIMNKQLALKSHAQLSKSIRPAFSALIGIIGVD